MDESLLPLPVLIKKLLFYNSEIFCSAYYSKVVDGFEESLLFLILSELEFRMDEIGSWFGAPTASNPQIFLFISVELNLVHSPNESCFDPDPDSSLLSSLASSKSLMTSFVDDRLITLPYRLITLPSVWFELSKRPFSNSELSPNSCFFDISSREYSRLLSSFLSSDIS